MLLAGHIRLKMLSSVLEGLKVCLKVSLKVGLQPSFSPLMLNALILYMSGKTYSLRSVRTTIFDNFSTLTRKLNGVGKFQKVTSKGL